MLASERSGKLDDGGGRVTRLSLALSFLAAAAASAILFLVALHPATGALGGIVYLLTSWALPSVLTGSLALGLAWLLPFPLALRIVAALVLSFVIGLNTYLPKIAEAASYRPRVSDDVRGAVAKPAEQQSRAIFLKQRPWGAVHTRPFGPRVRIGSDEGCGCMYFLDAETVYNDRVLHALRAATGSGSVAYYSRDPERETRDAYIDLTLWKETGGFRALVEVFDRGTKIAAFAHMGIPLDALSERAGVGREKLSVNFLENAIDILLHGNAWHAVMNAFAPEYFPEREVEAFLRAASGKP
jgi:hypothetical protein